MRIRKAKKDLGELGFAKEVWEELHSIGAEAGNVLIKRGFRILVAKSLNTVLHIFGDLGADLEAYVGLLETSTFIVESSTDLVGALQEA